MTSWSQDEDLKLMLEVINQQNGLKINWSKIATNMGRTVRAVNQHYDMLKKKASIPGPASTGNAATGNAKERRAGQASSGSTPKRKAKSKQARATQRGDEDGEEDVDDAEAIISNRVATSRSAKRSHHEAFQGASANKAIIETTETAVIDGDEDDEEDPNKSIPLGRDFYGSDGTSTSKTKKGSIKQSGILDGMTIGDGTETCKKKRARTGYGEERTLRIPSLQSNYLTEEEEEEKALESLGLQRDIKEENQED